MKQRVWRHKSFDIDGCNVAEAIVRLQTAEQEAINKGVEEPIISISGDDDGISCYVEGTGLETDEEYQARNQRELRSKMNDLERRRREYIKLKEEFGD